MKEEIKEIIESSRKIIKSNRENGFDRIILLGDDIDKLLDYITNLQEENKRLKAQNTRYEVKMNNLIQENNVLKENAEHNDKVVDKAKWNEMIYKSRNEKAIEYITSEETINMFSSINAREKWLKINHKLLNILGGSND